VISTDPTFADRSKTVTVVGTRPIPLIRTDVLPLDAPLYWRVEQPGGRGGVVSSDTYYFRYAER
jgi:hypothetical protein